jgi:hypothetical protein
MGRPRLDKPPKEKEALSYGERTTKFFEDISRDEHNAFGKFVIERIAQMRYSVQRIRRLMGIHYRRFISILSNKELGTSSEVEPIFRLAGALDEPEARLLAMYFQSRERYYSATYRTFYRLKEIPGPVAAQLAASFVVVWEAMVHSPHFENASPEKQGEMAQRTATLIEAFLNMPDQQQEMVLTMARSLSPREEVEVPPNARKDFPRVDKDEGEEDTGEGEEEVE